MPVNTYKVLSQTALDADVDTTLFIGGGSKQYVLSTIVVCNRGAAGARYRLAVRPNGEALASKHYVAYDVELYENDSITLTLGVTLDDGDVITARANTDDISISIFGVEITP